MNTRPFILIPIIAIGVIVIPLTLSIININTLNLDDTLIGTTDKDPVVDSRSTQYYSTETHVSENTYLFDEMWFTHQNYFQVIWRKINSTHYTLNISMESRNRQPDDYWFIGAVNTFTIQGDVTFKGTIYSISDSIYSHEGILITYFTLEQGEKCPISLDLQCDNTHNSDTGDVIALGQVNTTLTLQDPSHNDSSQVLYTSILTLSIISIIGLLISIFILVYREKLKQNMENKSIIPPQIRPDPTPETPQTINQNTPSSGIQRCSLCGSQRTAGAVFCHSCGSKFE